MATSGTPMTMSGFCQFPSGAGGSYTSHDFCRSETCTCPCHKREES